MSKCFVCGAILDEGLRFCPYCGEDQTKKPKPVTPSVSHEPKGIDLNMPLETYKKFMNSDDLYKVALAKLTGVTLKKNVNESIDILIELAKSTHIPSIMKLASLCLRDESSFTLGYFFLYYAAKLGDKEAISLMKKLGFDTDEFDVREIPKEVPFKEDDDIFFVNPKTNDIEYDILKKIIFIRTISSNGRRKKNGIGFVTEGGFILTSFSSINHGNYSSIKGRFLADDDSKGHPLKVEGLDSINEVVLLKLTEGEFDDLDIEENIDISGTIPKKGKVITVGIADGHVFVSKDEIVGLTKIKETKCDEELLKIKTSAKGNVTNAIFLNERNQAIGILESGNSKGKTLYAKTSGTILNVFKEI